MNGTSDRWFFVFLVADGFKREEEEITCGELQNAVFLIRGHGTMYNYTYIHRSYSHGDVHTKGSCLSMAKDRQTIAYGKQCSWKTGRNLHFNLPFLHGLNLRCTLLAGQPWHRSTCLGSEQIEVRGPHIEILPSGREAISQYPILPEVRDLRNHTHSN